MDANGTEIPLELTSTRMPGDGLPMFTAFVRDIGEPKAAEAAVRESREQYRSRPPADLDQPL